MNNSNSSNLKQDLENQSDHSSNHTFSQPQPQPQPQSRRPRGFAATAAAAAAAAATGGGGGGGGKGKKEREKEKERTKLRERHRRAITSRMLAGLRQYGNFPLPARADMNDVLAALAREAGWTVEADGTTYRQSPPPSQMATFPVRSVESPLSASSLRNCSAKGSLDCQPSVLRIDESLSPASLDSVVVTERDTKSEKYTSTSPISSAECLEADQLMRDVRSGEHENDFTGTPYVPVYVMLATGVINNFCQLVDPDGIRQELSHMKSLHTDGVVVDCWWGIVEGWSPQKYEWSGYRELFNIIREFKLKLQVVMAFHEYGGNGSGDVMISLPQWVLEIGKENQDIFFTDREGRRNTECLSWAIDKERVLKGRTGIEVYFDFMRSFRTEFDDLFAEGIISAVEIGLGASGELKYPSFSERMGWGYPGIGEFQCYDKYSQQNLRKAAKLRGHSFWARLTLLPLIALIFYEVSGGPFGVEDSVSAGGGPLLSLLGFLIFPLLWSIPEALVTAELATSFPENGGYVIWISAAFGPFWGFQEGFWKWFSGVMDNALYPVLFLDYLKHSFPIFNGLAARIPALLGITFSLTYLNYRGLHIVGFSAVSLAVFSLCPFIVMSILSIPRIRPGQWLVVDFKKVNWRGYFNSMFWNLNYWDKASTLAGEVEDPSRTFPKALLGAVVLVVSSYIIPLLAGTGALRSASSEWRDGYFAEVGMLIGGFWLKWWIQAAAAMSNMGLFEAEMSSDAFQLLGMSEIGMLPAIFASRSKYGTPTISILCSATGVIFLSWMSFQEIVEFLNFLYSIGMLLEFAAFIKLRIKKPDLHRPYKVPLQTFGVIMLCLPPSLLLVLVMCLASIRTFLVSGVVIVLGFFLYPTVVHAKDRKWARFVTEQPAVPSDNILEAHPIMSQLHQEAADEASVSLIPNLSSTKAEQESELLLEEALKME